MKKLLFIFLCIITCYNLVANINNNATIIVSIKNRSTSQTVSPRSAEIVPISCIYNGTDSVVYICFKKDIGEVSISIENLSTGESAYNYIDSAEGFTAIQTSGTFGDYLLQIETEYGDSYEGEFTINP